MGNVNLPTPVVIAAGVMCLAGGYLIGVVAGPDSPDRTTAVVSSYDARTSRLCLEGDGVADLEGADGDALCGSWQRVEGSAKPAVGDEFRFVSTLHEGQSGSDDDRVTIFGEVAD
ncbi:hypothetical protein [Nocardioides sp.]|uniref:hypothetical protein n=1 Tax=Nocardioides sp. TaxID=35761 RepID=UPI002BCD4BE2|nr:hypothetical protein [Nocardioides sp.]HSX67100.1 hypothetical protein [Nocardioides sp.]